MFDGVAGAGAASPGDIPHTSQSRHDLTISQGGLCAQRLGCWYELMLAVETGADVQVSERFPITPLRYRLFAPELHWQSRGEPACSDGEGCAQVCLSAAAQTEFISQVQRCVQRPPPCEIPNCVYMACLTGRAVSIYSQLSL